MAKPKPPQTDAEWSAYRIKLNCGLARDYLERTKALHSVTPAEAALYSIAHAFEELATLITLTNEPKNQNHRPAKKRG